ncbi:MAG TPA: phage major capsid protein, partial [Actinobacteria bacterium]|nr:phage major capsid protein [Actinomycetota bacterium]
EELLADATFDVVGFLATEVAENDTEAEELLFLTGSGSGEPLGILTHLTRLIAEGYTDLAAPVAAAATVTANDVRLFPLTLPIKYRKDGSWLFNRAFLRKVAALRTEEGGAGTGEFMFQRSLALGLPNTLDGYAAVESEFYPDNVTAGAQGDPLATFGSLRHYWIVDRAQLTVRLLGELYAETDEVGYKFHKRFDAAPVRAGAFRNMTRGA